MKKIPWSNIAVALTVIAFVLAILAIWTEAWKLGAMAAVFAFAGYVAAMTAMTVR